MTDGIQRRVAAVAAALAQRGASLDDLSHDAQFRIAARLGVPLADLHNGTRLRKADLRRERQRELAELRAGRTLRPAPPVERDKRLRPKGGSSVVTWVPLTSAEIRARATEKIRRSETCRRRGDIESAEYALAQAADLTAALRRLG